MPDRIWTKEIIQTAFKRFVNEHGRLPTSTDIPSARQIQRVFGGIPKLREELGYTEDLDYTRGRLRAKIALEGTVRGLQCEQALEIELVKRSTVRPYRKALWNAQESGRFYGLYA